MKSNYRKLGDFIQQVKNKNIDLITDDLRGLSMTKEFRKSTSNIVGTDLRKYKLVYNGQFACDFMSVIRVHKLPVVLHNEDDPVIVSPAYTVFKVKNDELLPEYLMMWFRRDEFDRYADFRCDSSVRGGFKWEELCEVELPIPPIEEQKAIVAEYQTVTDRIQLNEQINAKLEETAQALHRHWFVDFEFPDENGMPYKSSGGKMVYNEELEKEVPERWMLLPFDQVVKLSQGQVINAKTRHLVVEVGLPLLKITDLFKNTATMFIDPLQVNTKNIAKKDDLIYTRTGQVGYIFRNKEGVVYNNCFKIIPLNSSISKELLYWHFKDKRVRENIVELAAGSAQSDLTHSAFFSLSYLVPEKSIQDQFSKHSKYIYSELVENENVIHQLNAVKTVLLSKMASNKSPQKAAAL